MAMKLIELTEEQRNALQQLELSVLIRVDNICKKHNITYWLGYGTLLGCIRHKGFIPWDDDIDICMPRADFERFRLICATELPIGFFYQSHLTDPDYYHLHDKIRINNTLFLESFMYGVNINHGIYFDIFPIDYMADGLISGNLQYYRSRILRAIIYSKFLNPEARVGKKRIAVIVLRSLFKPFSTDKMWKKAERIASKYSNTPQKRIGCFMSPYGKNDFFPTTLLSDFIEKQFEGYSFQIPKEYDKVLSGVYGDYMALPPIDKQRTRHDLLKFSINNLQINETI